MLRPSHTLSFRAVASLNKFKIHQPSPLDKRESQRLLELLTSSFRKHLDAEHPIPSSTLPSNSTPSLPPPTPKKPRRHSMSDLGRNATERHMTSLLTNPLFDLPQRKNEEVLEAKDPMDVFDRAVAAGMMNTKHATAILMAKERTLERSGLGSSGAGFKVLRWLISSGQFEQNSFLKDHSFTFILTRFLVYEGLQEAAWTWVKRSLEQISRLPSVKDKTRDSVAELAQPLQILIEAELNHRSSPDSACSFLSRAAETLSHTYEPHSFSLALRGPVAAITRASRQPTDAHVYRPASESAFEKLLDVVAKFRPKGRAYYTAQLCLVHPTKPSSLPALEYLRSVDADGPEKTPVSMKRESAVVWLGLKCSDLLLSEGDTSNAHWVMSFLKRLYSHRLGIERTEESEHSKGETDEHFLRGFSVA